MMNAAKRKNMSLISAFHYAKLIFRSCLFVVALIIYIADSIRGIKKPIIHTDIPSLILVLIWFVFIGEMILRFFPSHIESMGCQKQFKRNYIPSEAAGTVSRKNFKPPLNPREPRHSLLIVIASWLLLNGIFFALFFTGIIDEGIMILLSLAYSVCDMICILFFCPFQEWMMKNKCCGSCRIYNWDYAMMFTPLIFVKSAYTATLIIMALLLLVNWEVDYRLHPERFYEVTNEALSCRNCREKLCSHKKSLRLFLAKRGEALKKALEKIEEKSGEE